MIDDRPFSYPEPPLSPTEQRIYDRVMAKVMADLKIEAEAQRSLVKAIEDEVAFCDDITEPGSGREWSELQRQGTRMAAWALHRVMRRWVKGYTYTFEWSKGDSFGFKGIAPPKPKPPPVRNVDIDN